VDQALARIRKDLKPGDLLYHLEAGLLLRYLDRWEESDRELDRAESLVEELYTESLSRKALSLLLNETVEAYRGNWVEWLMIPFYRALDFLDRGELSEAVVEARKMSILLEVLEDEDPPGFHPVPMLSYFTGVLYEAAGEGNDALVAYRRAWRESRNAGPGGRSAVARSLVRVARRLGATDVLEAEGVEADDEPSAPAGSLARLVVLVEEGWIPGRREVRLRFPILEEEEDLAGAALERHAGVFLSRIETYRATGWWFSEPVEVAYWVEVAVPTLEPPGGVPGRLGLRVGGRPVPASLTLDLDALTRSVFEAQSPGILLRAVLRALAKYGVHRLAKKEAGELAGILANVAGILTERADTRCWSLLPGRVWLAEAWLSPGPHEIWLEWAQEGETNRVFLGRVHLNAGETRILSHRIFP
jgi:hypothetical protein